MKHSRFVEDEDYPTPAHCPACSHSPIVHFFKRGDEAGRWEVFCAWCREIGSEVLVSAALTRRDAVTSWNKEAPRAGKAFQKRVLSKTKDHETTD